MTDRITRDGRDLELLQAAVDSSSPLTILDNFSTIGMITDDAAHWQIEPFVPMDEIEVRRMLDLRKIDAHAAMNSLQWERFLRVIDRHLDQWSGMRSRRIMSAYRLLDPDRRRADHDDEQDLKNSDRQNFVRDEDTSPDDNDHQDTDRRQSDCNGDNSDRSSVGVENPPHPSKRVCDEVRQLAIAAGYTPIAQDQIEQCVGIASHWGVPLHIDFDAFERLDVYARGDVIGYRLRRILRSLYRRKVVEVPVYRKMLVAFEMKGNAKYVEPTTDHEMSPEGIKPLTPPPRCIHLRLFKNIPKTDVDMLLPTAKVKISGVDRLKIVLPSLGGFLMSLRKIAQFTLLLAALALHWAAILAAITVGYLVKTSLSYFQTKNRYQLNLTKNLYFQKVASGDVVLTALVAQAVNQKRVEAMLAYYALMVADEPLSTRRLKRRCQRFVREGLEIEIDFRVNRAITLLVDTGLIHRQGDGWSIAEQNNSATIARHDPRSAV